MSEEIDIAKQWLAKARNDLLNVDNNLKAQEVPFDTVCFHCQQAAEKLLKAYLAGNRQSYPVTHDLFLILEKILPLRGDAEQLRDALAILMPYAVEIRYPDDWFMPSDQDAKEARDAASQVLQWLEDALPEIFQSSQAS
ncbi:MAG: HEPN domain-containing protein [Desulfobacterales bacterium]|nr:HEPN domain-containing protein [Desulfobacterales bacterium]